MSRSLYDRKDRPFLDQTGFFGDHDYLKLFLEPAVSAVISSFLNEDDGERWVQEQLWPDPSVQAYAIQPQAAPAFDPATVPWAREGGELQAQPGEDPSVQAWPVGPPQNVVADQSWNQDQGEVFVQPQLWPDPTEEIGGYVPPQLRAWSIEGGEVQAQPTEDPSVQSWPVGPPQNAVALQAFNQPDEAQAQPVDDPTTQTYPIQPPAAAGFDPAAGFPWAAEGGEVQAQPVVDDTAPAWAVTPPQNAVIAQAFNQPDEAPYAPTEDPTTPALTIPSYLPGFPFNADDSERFYQQQLVDDNVGYALGLVPLNAAQAQAFNTPQDALEVPIADPSVQAWPIPPQDVFAPPFNPGAGFPWNQDEGERWVDGRWSFLWADLINDWGDRGAVPIYPVPPTITPPTITQADPWFRRRQPPPSVPIEAWSLWTSLVARYGLAEGQQVYQRMLAERKGPFQAGAKYDPDRGTPTKVVPHISIPKAKRS